MTQYTDGDAKWYFTPVVVKPETEYIFTDTYRSNIVTHTVAEASLADGSVEYLYLGQNAKSKRQWKTVSYQFKTSATATKITVFHLISQVGKLDINNVSLTEVIPVAPAGIVPNPSAEQTSNGIAPDSWISGSWAPTLRLSPTSPVGIRAIRPEGRWTQYTDG